jgi:hypothetical protein
LEGDHIIETNKTVHKGVKTNSNGGENKSAIYLPPERPLSPKNAIPELVENSYRSPKNKVETNRLHQSPASEMRLGKKVENSIGFSERLQRSDRKPATASKVERLRHEM